MNWIDIESFLGDLTTFSLGGALLLYLAALRWPLRTLAYTAMGMAWITSTIALVGHLVTTGHLPVWWLGIWWVILWYASFEIPLSTRVLGIPTALIGLLFLRHSFALSFSWNLLSAVGLMLGGSLLLFATLLPLLFGWQWARRFIPWIGPELLEGLMERLAVGSLFGLLPALLAEIIAFFSRPPRYGVVAELILAIALVLVTLNKRISPLLLGAATLLTALAATSIGMIRW